VHTAVAYKGLYFRRRQAYSKAVLTQSRRADDILHSNCGALWLYFFISPTMAKSKSKPKVSEEVFFEPENLDRDKMFAGKDASNYLWCLHCERAYQRGKFRRRGSLQMCPYPNCSGDAVMDARDWAKVRGGHPTFPEVPEEGVHYPLY
jgi:hypothetical protein